MQSNHQAACICSVTCSNSDSSVLTVTACSSLAERLETDFCMRSYSSLCLFRMGAFASISCTMSSRYLCSRLFSSFSRCSCSWVSTYAVYIYIKIGQCILTFKNANNFWIWTTYWHHKYQNVGQYLCEFHAWFDDFGNCSCSGGHRCHMLLCKNWSSSWNGDQKNKNKKLIIVNHCP